MPYKLPPHVERNHVKGKTYLYFRFGNAKTEKPFWYVDVGDVVDHQIVEYEATNAARRWHTQGQKLMRSDPQLAHTWAHNLKLAKEIIDTKWKPTFKKRG